jgi:hypothetical protein
VNSELAPTSIPSTMSHNATTDNNHSDTAITDPGQKALHINLDDMRYGTLAEIGAGQEVASWFFRVGAASGTIAKSMSAYDMTFSDSIYGKTGRYVSKERLLAMLNHEYSLLLERLAPSRGSTTGFFVFADTVSARNFTGTNECHGWMGIRFQSAPGAEPDQIIVHVHMNDKDTLRQQEALGILGVNLVFAAFYRISSISSMLGGLADGLDAGRVEVDYIEVSGPSFSNVEPRTINIALIRTGLASAILFDTNQRPIPSTEFFHKRPILLERGTFRALHQMFPGLAQACQGQLKNVAGVGAKEAAYVLEITLNNILRTQQSTDDEVLTVVAQLCAHGNNVLVSNYSEFFHLTQYLRRFSQLPIGFIVSVALLPLLLEDERYSLLKGGVLEASARLFQQQVHLLVYPVETKLFKFYLELIKFDISKVRVPRDGMVMARNLTIQDVNNHLLRYLIESGIVVDVPVAE